MMPTGRSPVDDDGRTVGTLGEQDERLAGRGRRRQGDRGVVDEVAGLDELDDLADDVDGDVLRDDGSAPRRAVVSAIRRPAIAVMFATTMGIVVPLPSTVERSTSSRLDTSDRFGTRKTSS